MIRDEKMKALVAPDKEPITAFVRSLGPEKPSEICADVSGVVVSVFVFASFLHHIYIDHRYSIDIP